MSDAINKIKTNEKIKPNENKNITQIPAILLKKRKKNRGKKNAKNYFFSIP